MLDSVCLSEADKGSFLSLIMAGVVLRSVSGQIFADVERWSVFWISLHRCLPGVCCSQHALLTSVMAQHKFRSDSSSGRGQSKHSDSTHTQFSFTLIRTSEQNSGYHSFPDLFFVLFPLLLSCFYLFFLLFSFFLFF